MIYFSDINNLFLLLLCYFSVFFFRTKVSKSFKMSAMQRDVLKSKLPPLPSKPMGQASRFSSL